MYQRGSNHSSNSNHLPSGSWKESSMLYCTSAKQSTLVHDKHIMTCSNVRKYNEWGRLYNVHIRSKSNRNSIAVHNFIRMYVILSNRAVRSWQIVSPEKCLLWPSISKSSTNSTRTSASTRNSWSSMIMQLWIMWIVVFVTDCMTVGT